jgi:acetoin utilization protein AcuB
MMAVKGQRIMLTKALVRDWMTTPAISVSPADSIQTANKMMREFGIRHLPVVQQERLVGILTISDIREASPSDATTLSVWEINYLWEQLTVERVMTKQVITVRPDDLVVDAVHIMLDRKISCLPVIDADGFLLGIVTAVDALRLLLELAEQVAE